MLRPRGNAGNVLSGLELTYEFVANTIRSTALFMFILTVNIIGLIPYNFTVTTHIIITSTLALSVFLTVLVYDFWKHGLHFFNLFVELAQRTRTLRPFIPHCAQRSNAAQFVLIWIKSASEKDASSCLGINTRASRP
jgi:F0F1-type ATP synthase membrane subunit a